MPRVEFTPLGGEVQYGLTEAGVNDLSSQNGARVFHIEPYFVSGQKRFAAIMVNNSNEVETRVGEATLTPKWGFRPDD